ncbi:hypothetical protein LZ31DRAFT_590730 [Colletotrichum somersetense]|nr:hypothetical protein LZ31DRAFT_590730 [Colletotrichum somersetense]
MSIFSLKPVSLTSLTIRRVGWFGVAGSLYANLQSLSLYGCAINSDRVNIMMKACRGLRKFAFTAHSPAATPKKCITALRQHSSTLVELHLLVRGEDLWDEMYGDDDVYDSFASFTSLKILSVHPLDFIIHPLVYTAHHPDSNHHNMLNFDMTPMESIIDTLPKSLEVFKVIGWFPGVKRSLIRLGEIATQGDLPNLKLLEVECYVAVNDLGVQRDVDTVKSELLEFKDRNFELPLRINAYGGHCNESSAQSPLQVWHV